jgi:hypothetical protein
MGWSWADEQGTPLSVLDKVAEMIHTENVNAELAQRVE